MATSSDVFNIIQKRPNTVVHLKVDEALEGVPESIAE